MKKVLIIFFVCLLLPIFCNASRDIIQKNKLIIFVSILPQKGITEAIGGQFVDVNVMVPPSGDPHEYQPTPIQIFKLGKADAYLKIGIPFEKIILDKINPAELRFFDTAFGIKMDTIEEDNVTVPDIHVWLSPSLVKIIAKNTYQALAELVPAKKVYFEENYNTYIRKVDKMDFELKKILAPYKGKTFIVFHPSFGYFTKVYGLKQKFIKFENSDPTPKKMIKLMNLARTEKIKIIFIEPQLSQEAANVLAKQIKGEVVVINPLAEDVLATLKDIGAKLEASFKK